MPSNPNPLHREVHERMDDEIVFASRKHNGHTPRSWSMGDGEALAVLVEEVGEVARALTYDEGGDYQKLADELIQTATMAAAWAERILIRGDDPNAPALIQSVPPPSFLPARVLYEGAAA